MTVKKESLGDKLNNALFKGIGEMNHVKWIVAKKELGMTKEEISADPLLYKVLAVWNLEENPTPEQLRALLEVSDRELTKRLGVDYDALIAEGVAEAEKDDSNAA